MENFNGLNLSTASDIKIGSDDVQSVYLGSKLIWSRLGFQDYFTVKAVEQGYIEIKTGKYPTFGSKRNYDGITNSYGINAPVDDIYYSINNGSWQRVQVNFYNVSSEGFRVTINVAKDDIVKIKSISLTDKYFPIKIDSSNKIELSGNIMSLVYGDDFENTTQIKYTDYFCWLFAATKCTSAENLKFPPNYAYTAYRCFLGLFENCIYLNKLPTFRIWYAPYGAFSYLNANTPATSISIFVRDWADNPYDQEQVVYSSGWSTINSFLFAGNSGKVYFYDKNGNGYVDETYRWNDHEDWPVDNTWYKGQELSARKFTIKVGKTKYKRDYQNPNNYMQEDALYNLLNTTYHNLYYSEYERYKEIILLNEYA